MSYTADFELGTVGNTIAAADPGSLSAWQFVFIGGGNALTYDNAFAVGGTKSAHFANTGGSLTNQLCWWNSVGSYTDYYGRFYLKQSTFGTNLLLSHVTGDVNGADCWTLYFTTGSGFIQVRDSANTVIYTFTNGVNPSGWCRIEYHAVHSTGDLEVKLFNTASSTTPTETSSIASGQSLQANAVSNRHCFQQLNADAYMDDIVAFATSYPGPIAPATNDIMIPLGRLGTGGSVYKGH